MSYHIPYFIEARNESPERINKVIIWAQNQIAEIARMNNYEDREIDIAIINREVRILREIIGICSASPSKK